MSNFAKPTELDYNRAYNAYRNVSFSPEKRAAQAQKEFADTVNQLYERLLKIAISDEQKELLQTELTRFKQGYLSRNLSRLDAMSRCASSMITGPANFPTARNEKRINTERKRLDEMLAFICKAEDVITKRLLALRTPDEVFESELLLVKRKLAGYHTRHNTEGAAGFIKRIANRGDIRLAQAGLEFLKTLAGTPLFTERHSVWEILELNPILKSEPEETEEAFVFSGGRVVKNYDANRLQILFDSKPDDALRYKLKGSGWRWSPSFGAWQRQLTNNAIHSAQNILQEVRPD